ncbi:bifunctional 23S rRNA [Sesbania bispinosa]|nr:bifunctional 23S rRNA [Sesbania bispinosa]
MATNTVICRLFLFVKHRVLLSHHCSRSHHQQASNAMVEEREESSPPIVNLSPPL